MKALLLLILTLFLYSCQQQEESTVDDKASSEQPSESIEVAETEEIEESGGTEVVAKPKTKPPQFESINVNTYADSFEIQINCSGLDNVNISEIRVKGFNESAQESYLSIMTTSHPELFDGLTNSFNEYDKCINVNVSFELLERSIIKEVEFYFNTERPKVKDIYISYILGYKHRIYSATNLLDERANFFSSSGATVFSVQKSDCEEGYSQNYDGSCYIPRILCTDFNSELEDGKKACSIKRDGQEVYCMPVVDNNQCNNLSSNICGHAANYLNMYSQLFTLHYEDNQVASEVCQKPKR